MTARSSGPIAGGACKQVKASDVNNRHDAGTSKVSPDLIVTLGGHRDIIKGFAWFLDLAKDANEQRRICENKIRAIGAAGLCFRSSGSHLEW